MFNSTRDRLANELLEGRADATGTRNGRVDAFLGELRVPVHAEPLPTPTGRLATLLRDGRSPLEPVAPLAFVRRPTHVRRRARVAALVAEVMGARGYPMVDFEQRAADISVSHPDVVEHYRAAHEIAQQHRQRPVSTEELRKAFLHYRALFASLLEVEPIPEGQDARAEVRR